MAVPSPLSQPRRMWDGTGDWPHATEAAHVPLLPLSSSLPGALTMTAGCPGPVHPRLLALPGAEVGIWGGRSSGGGAGGTAVPAEHRTPALCRLGNAVRPLALPGRKAVGVGEWRFFKCVTQ